MRISATVNNDRTRHQVVVRTDDRSQELDIAARPSGGSAVNGGEFLMLALATCYCNDLYREAARPVSVHAGIATPHRCTPAGRVGANCVERRSTVRT